MGVGEVDGGCWGNRNFHSFLQLDGSSSKAFSTEPFLCSETFIPSPPLDSSWALNLFSPVHSLQVPWQLF